MDSKKKLKTGLIIVLIIAFILLIILLALGVSEYITKIGYIILVILLAILVIPMIIAFIQLIIGLIWYGVEKVVEIIKNKNKGFVPRPVRYSFEHRMLPQMFYRDPSSLIELLTEDIGLYVAWRLHCKNFGIEIPGGNPRQFKVEQVRVDDSTSAFILTMPPPEKIAHNQCRYIFLMFDKTLKKLAYYTLEEDIDADFICGWDANGNHLNYGIHDGKNELFPIIVELFTKN